MTDGCQRITLGRVFLATTILMATLTACGGENGEGRTGDPSGEPVDGGQAEQGDVPESEISVDGDETGDTGGTVTLYFADANGELSPERRRMVEKPLPADQARAVVQALLDGPRAGLSPVIPADTKIRAVHLAPDGTVYVDLDDAFAIGLSSGSEDALIAIRAVTETLAANIEGVHQVKILVEGEEVRELGGHLDLSRPMVPSARLLAGDG